MEWKKFEYRRDVVPGDWIWCEGFSLPGLTLEVLNPRSDMAVLEEVVRTSPIHPLRVLREADDPHLIVLWVPHELRETLNGEEYEVSRNDLMVKVGEITPEAYKELIIARERHFRRSVK